MAKSTEPRTDPTDVEVRDPRQETTEQTGPNRVPPAVLQAGAPGRIDDATLRGIQSFEDAVNAAAETHGFVDDYAEKYGTGFDVVDKAVFVNKTIVLMEWRFSRGDFGPFVSAAVMAKDGSKGIINDGSTGVFEQLYQVTADEGKYGGLLVAKGLRLSEYDTCPGHVDSDGTVSRPCGKPRPVDVSPCPVCGSDAEARIKGRTFYLDQSKN